MMQIFARRRSEAMRDGCVLQFVGSIGARYTFAHPGFDLLINNNYEYGLLVITTTLAV
jgi:hypothetical protein